MSFAHVHAQISFGFITLPFVVRFDNGKKTKGEEHDHVGTQTLIR